MTGAVPARALIVYSDTGGGHRSVARALAEALDARGVTAEIVDLFALGAPGLGARLTRLYPFMIRRAPRTYGAVFHLTDRPAIVRAMTTSLGRRAVATARQLLRDREPDVVLVVHPLCNLPLVEARGSGRRPPIVSVVTELVTVHASWHEPRLDAWTAPTAEAEEALVRLGAPRERIDRTGLPIGRRFAGLDARPERLRSELGLEPDRFTVLLSGGGEGAGRLDRAVAAIDASDLEAQLIVVCGRNERLRQRLAARRFARAVRVFGFVDNMPELLRAADVLVAKGGPQTICEALAAGRPILVTSMVPGQEEGNDRWVERHGVGLHVPTPERLVAALARLERDGEALARLSAAALALAQPEAADRVVDRALALAGGERSAAGSA